MFRNLKLRTRILASIGLVVLLSFSIVIFIVSLKSVEIAKTSAHQIAAETASINGTYVREKLEVAMDNVRTLSYTFQELKKSRNADRETMNKILVNVLEDNPQFVATWTLWEPNALDSRDAEYIDKPGYDRTGRFIPYWSRHNGKVNLEPLVNYEAQGAGDYYLIPKTTMRETIIEPYFYPIVGKEVLITSVVMPIIVDGTFVGVVGIDIALDTIQKVVTNIKPFGTGSACLLSNEGKYVAHQNLEMIGKKTQDEQVKAAIKLGKSYVMTSNGMYEIYVPLTIGRTTTPWSMAVSIPLGKVYEQANNIRNFAFVIGIVAILIIGLVIFLVASTITNQHLEKEVWERKQIQDKILRLASIVECTDDGIIGMTVDGIILDWNKGAEFIYGYTEAEILGESIRQLIPAGRQSELEKELSNISQGIPISHYETQRQRKDGQQIHVYLTVSPIKDQWGFTVGASIIIRDVTAQKKFEKEMLRMDQMYLVGEMAASISHEVRNPMTTVRGFLQLLEKKQDDKKYREYIPLMISELDRANSIITEFLSLSRTKTTEFARHNLNDILKSILPLVQMDALRGEQRVSVELGTIPDLLLDDKEIRQVILNLTRNGLEAMGNCGSLSIKTFCTDDKVVLAIGDQGPGIEPEIIDQLGTPFLTTKDQGTGLGLAVCYGIAARHNANISVETSPLGSTFFVNFRTLEPIGVTL